MRGLFQARIRQAESPPGSRPLVRNRLLLAGILIALAFTGSAFSQALDIHIRSLLLIPSLGGLPPVPDEAPQPFHKAAPKDGPEIEIRPIRILAARAQVSSPALSGAEAEPPPALPALVQKEALFDPARFDPWDRKHKAPAEEREVRETWVLVAGLAFQYDTNLYRNPTEDDPAVGGVADVGDGSVIAWAGAEYRLGLDDRLESAIHLDLRTQRHFEESGADTTAVSVGAYIHDRWSWGGLHLPYSYTYWWDGPGFQARASVHSLRPMIYWSALENYRIEATAVYENRQYFDQTHDAHRLALELGHRYDFARPGTYLRLDKRLSNDFAGEEGYLLAEVALSGGLAVWQGLRLDAGLSYAHFWFDDRPATDIGQAGTGSFARQDNQFRANAKLCYQFSPAWQVGLDYVLTLNDSNVEGSGGFDPYNFHKHVLTLLASGRF